MGEALAAEWKESEFTVWEEGILEPLARRH